MTLQKQFRQIEIGCKSPMPLRIKNAFNSLETKVRSYFNLSTLNDDYDDFHKGSFQSLSQAISRHRFFPMHLPKAYSVVEEVKRYIDKEEADEVERHQKANINREKAFTERRKQRAAINIKIILNY